MKFRLLAFALLAVVLALFYLIDAPASSGDPAAKTKADHDNAFQIFR